MLLVTEDGDELVHKSQLINAETIEDYKRYRDPCPISGLLGWRLQPCKVAEDNEPLLILRLRYVMCSDARQVE